MPINPQVQTLLEMLAQAPAIDYATITPYDLRATHDIPLQQGPPPSVARVHEVSIPLDGRTLAARLYVPDGAGETPPLLVYYHGGGWVIGTLDTHDGICRALANASGAAILSVAYRLAPEHVFPAPLDDCYDALVWASQNAAALGADASRLAVGGDSAGGNLAAAVAIMVRDRRGPALRHQLLIYPVTDADFTRPSYDQNGAGNYFLSTAMMRWFWARYLGNTPAEQAPLATILQAKNLAGLAPASVYTAEFDPLCDEGMFYADKLIAAGVAVDAACAPGMIHGFFSMFSMVPDAMPWIERAGANLAKSFA
jgi:acetyl esterase